MKRTLLTAVVLVDLFGVSGVVAAADGGWRVGYAGAEITPKAGQVQMAGFGRERYNKGTLGPLWAQVLALRDGEGQTSVLITADVLDFDRVMADAIRYAIAKKHGIAGQRVLLAPSHTHWGPAIRFKATYSCGAPNVWYVRFLEETILEHVVVLHLCRHHF